MNSQYLKNFFENTLQKDAVKEFQIVMLREMAADKAFAGEDTKGIQEAAECIEKCFDKLEEVYGKIKKPVITNSR